MTLPERPSPQLHLGFDQKSSPTAQTATVVNFPDEVLLEIFDSYRQSFGDKFSSERVWNSKSGWFKLAHVCHNWRSIVLGSPSRLRLRLYFAHNTPTRVVALKCFSHLQVIVDYSDATWKASATKRFATALRYPDRVYGIAVRRSARSSDNLKISEALDLPFPALESLELENNDLASAVQPIVLPTSLTNSIQSLRHLRLVNQELTSILPLLPGTGTLVDLNLKIDTVFDVMSGASLLTYLQHMPHLRNLQVTTHNFFGPTVPPSRTVLLAGLTSIRLFGSSSQTEGLLAGLVTPSLRELHISAIDRGSDGVSHGFDVPYLSKFIRVVGIRFVAARLAVSPSSRMTQIALFTPPHSTDEPPSQVVTIYTQIGTNLGRAFSKMLAILEDIFLSISANRRVHGPLLGDLVAWRKFFEHFCNAKVLRLHHGLEMEVAFLLWQPSVDPPPPRDDVDPDTMTSSGTTVKSSRSQWIFPSLEEIVVYPRTPDASIDAEERASALEPFGLFKAARHQMGRPVKVSWNTDGEIPVCSLMDHVDQICDSDGDYSS